MSFTTDGLTTSLGVTKNYQVPLYYSYLKTGSFRTNLGIDGKELRNYALNCNYLASRVTRWKAPGYFLGPLSNSMAKDWAPAFSYFDYPGPYNQVSNFASFNSSKFIATNLRMASTGNAACFVSMSLFEKPAVSVSRDMSLNFVLPDTSQDESSFIRAFSTSLPGGGSVQTKECIRYDLHPNSNFVFTASGQLGNSSSPGLNDNNNFANQYTDVNSFNPASPLACAPMSESYSIPGLFKSVHFARNKARKILWKHAALLNFQNLQNDTNIGCYATSGTKRNFFLGSGAQNYLPKPWVFATAMDMTQSSKPVSIWIVAYVGVGNVGRFEITNSITSAYTNFTTSTNGAWQRLDMLWPTDSAAATTGLIASQLNGSGSLDINLWKTTTADATLFQVFDIVIDERM